MSIILDALKKAENENKDGNSPMQSGANPAQRGSMQKTWQIIVAIGALCVGLAALVAAFSLLITPKVAQQAAPSPTLVPVQQTPLRPVTEQAPGPADYEPVQPRERASSSRTPPATEDLRPRRSWPVEEGSVATPPSEPETEAVGAGAPPDSGPASDDNSSKKQRSLSISMSEGGRPVIHNKAAGAKAGTSGKKAMIDIRQIDRGSDALQESRQKRSKCLSHLSKARRLARDGRDNESLAEFKRALSIEPDNELALLGMGSFLFDEGRFHEAEGYFRRGIAVGKGTPQVRSALHSNLGLVLYRMGHLDDSVRAYETAISLFDGNVSALNNLAIAYKDQGKAEMARRTYARILVLDNRNSIAYYGLGLLYDENRRWQDAIFNYTRFLVLAGTEYKDLQGKVGERVQVLKQLMSEEKPTFDTGKEERDSSAGPFIP